MIEKIIFFDVANTLLHLKKSVTETYADFASTNDSYINPKLLKQPLKEVWNELSIKYNDVSNLKYGVDEKSSKQWWNLYVNKVFERAGYKGDINTFFDKLYYYFGSADPWILYDDAIETIVGVKKKGYKTGILSNWDHRLKNLIIDLDIDKYFDHIFISSYIGYEKPNRRIFEHALNISGIKPEDAYHIGDSYREDILGALNVGIKPLFIRREKEFGEVDIDDSKDIIILDNLKSVLDVLY